MDKAHKATDKRLEAMERELAAIYREAQKGISDKAAAYFDQFIKQDEKKRKLVADGKLSEDEYLQWRKNKLLYSKRFVTLQGQITGELARVNQTAAAYINDQLPDVYALNYNYVGKGVQRAVKGYSFTLIDANTVKRLATKTDGLLPKRKVDVPKDKLWNAKKMRTQVLQGILQGESMDKIADRMQTVTDMNGVSAIRNARTMVTGAENAGRIDMMHRAAADGVIMRKLWIATTDSRTRDWHRDLDDKEADIDEPFHNDFGDIMFPGDPTADGANVYNCRCALGYRVVGFGKAQVQEAMDTPKNKYGEEIAFDFGGASDEVRKQIKSDISYLSDIYDTGLREVQYVKKAFIGGEAGNVDVTGSIMTLHKASITKHEFFHTLDMSSRSKKIYGGKLETNNDFWKEAKPLFSKYKKEAVHDISRRISEYSTTNVDEFMSEAFSVYYGGKPADPFGVGIESPYVNEAVRIIDKYFKRKKK